MTRIKDSAYAWKARYVPVRFGYHDPDPKAFTSGIVGLRHYLECVGPFKHFTADEITRPHHPQLAADLGHGERLLAPQEWWPRYAGLLSIAQTLREYINEPIRIRNAYRPSSYNASVGGSERSDHLWALAFDCDFKSPESRREAEEWLKKLAGTDPWLRLSLGLGNTSIHFGILSAAGQRTWKYPSYVLGG